MAFWSLLFLSALITIAASAYDPPANDGYGQAKGGGGGVKGGRYEDPDCNMPGCNGGGIKRPDRTTRRTTTRRPYTTTTRRPYTTTRRPYTTTTTRRPYTTTTTRRPYTTTTTRRPYTTTTRRPYTTTTRKPYTTTTTWKPYTTTPWRPFSTTTTRRPVYPIWPDNNKIEDGEYGGGYNPGAPVKPRPPVRPPNPGIRDVDGYGNDYSGNSNNLYDSGNKNTGTKSGNYGVKYGK